MKPYLSTDCVNCGNAIKQNANNTRKFCSAACLMKNRRAISNINPNKPSLTSSLTQPEQTNPNTQPEHTYQDSQFIQDPFTHQGIEQNKTGKGKDKPSADEVRNAKREGVGVPMDNVTPHSLAVPISITPLTYKPNWVVLAELFPEKLRNKEDAMRYLWFCLNEDKKKILKHSPTQEAVFWQGGERRVLTEGGIKAEKKKFIPEFIKYFK